MRDDFTALILCYNERENIERALRALEWVPHVLIVDSFSTDETIGRARKYPNVEIVQRPFDTHTAQWNFGVDHVSTSWVLSLDADYEVSKELQVEIEELLPADGAAGYSAGFEFRIFGKPLRSSAYPPRTVLFRRDRARYQPDGHTQLLRCEGEVVPLRGLIYHDDRKPLSRWLRSQDQYAVLESNHLLSLDPSQLAIQDKLRLKLVAPVVMLLYLLFVRGLILDGWPGWYYVCQRTIAELLLSLRLITERERLEDPTIIR